MAQQLDRRPHRLAQEIKRAGQQNRDNAGRRHRLNAREIGIFEVIGRERSETSRKRRAVQVRQLIGVKPDHEAVRLRGLEYPRGLFGRKADAFTEGVHRLREALRGHGGNHLGANQIDVGVCVLGLGRKACSAQKGGHDGHRAPSKRARAARSCLSSVSRSRP